MTIVGKSSVKESEGAGSPSDGTGGVSDETCDDETIILRSMNGHHDAFRELLERYDPRIRYYVRRLVHDYDLADDVMQEVWIIIYRKISALRSAKAFATWAYRIARHRAIKEIKRKDLLVFTENLDDLAAQVPDCDHFQPEIDAEMLTEALTSLKPAFREVLTLRYLEDLSCSEISAIVGISEGTVKSRLYYARLEMQVLLRRMSE